MKLEFWGACRGLEKSLSSTKGEKQKILQIIGGQLGSKNPPKRGAREVLPNVLIFGAAPGRFLGKSGGPWKYFQLVGSTSPDFHPQNHFPEPRSTSSLVLVCHNLSRALNLNPKIGKFQFFLCWCLQAPIGSVSKPVFFYGFLLLSFSDPDGFYKQAYFFYRFILPCPSDPDGFYKQACFFPWIVPADSFKPQWVL